MFRYLKAVWYLFTGRLERARASLSENANVMAATYDAAIKKTQANFETTKEAITELVKIEQDLVVQIKSLGDRMNRLSNVRNGAQVAMQKRVDVLRTEGKSKEEILRDSEFIKHKAAFDDSSSTLTEITSQYDEKNAALEERKRQIATYKSQLQKMQRASDNLRTEKQEALADVAIAKQSEAIDAQLAGLTNNSFDEDLKEAREARQRAKARAKITAELAGNDAKLAEEEYLDYANKQASTSELDGLLDWGDEQTNDLSPAKLPE